jgi:hypothetical protein
MVALVSDDLCSSCGRPYTSPPRWFYEGDDQCDNLGHLNRYAIYAETLIGMATPIEAFQARDAQPRH